MLLGNEPSDKGALFGQVRRFQAVKTQQFGFFEEAVTRILLIFEGYPRLNANQSSHNVLEALKTLSEKNHEMFSAHFIDKLIDLVEIHRTNVDASLLHALLQVQNVFNCFQRVDEKVLLHLRHQTTIFNETKAMHQERKLTAEEKIAKCQKEIVFSSYKQTIPALLSKH